MLNNPSQVPYATHVSGRRVAHLKRNAVYRAFLAADLVRGQVVLRKPTIKQAAELLKVSPASSTLRSRLTSTSGSPSRTAASH
jgi:hypothetical protein